MTFIAPDVERPSGSTADAEKETLTGILDFHRATLLHKCAGLTAAQLSTAPYPTSNLTLHGLLRHMAKVERIWFRERFAAEGVARLYSTPERKDADFEDVDPATVEADYAALVAEQAAAQTITAGAALDDTYLDADGDKVSLRFIHVHMIGEYARHNGHADFLREGVDGNKGY